jgi:predicted nucleotidyltransferase
MIDISPSDLKIVKDILQKVVPDCEVRAFGSRVGGKVKKYSDLDLVLVGKKQISIGVLGDLKEEFQESDLLFRVDVIDWNSTSPEFRKIIEKNYAVIQRQP